MANPISLMLAAAMMLEHVGRAGDAQRLKQAISATINTDKVATRDLGGTAGTRQFAGRSAGGSSVAAPRPQRRRRRCASQATAAVNTATSAQMIQKPPRSSASGMPPTCMPNRPAMMLMGSADRDQRQREQRAVVLLLQARRDLFLQQPDALDQARHVAQHDGEFLR